MSRKRICYDHTGQQFESVKDMCEHWGINPQRYLARIRTGWTVMDALTLDKSQRQKTFTRDPFGNQYKSKAALYRKYNTCSTTVEYRTKHMGMSLKDALTVPFVDNTGGIHTVKDHLGNEFSSKEAMCTHWGIPRATFFRRIRIGWSLEEALTTPLKHTYKPERKLIDPNGDAFASIEEMCAKWNVPKKDYVMNIKMGYSVKDALSIKPDVNWRRGACECKDHKGNKFPSFNAMFEHYGVKKDTVRGRIDLGWTLEQILESPTKKHPSKPCVDHLGNKYPRQKDMLTAYGVSQVHFRWRMRKGWTLEECLLGQGLHRNEVTDVDGNKYPSEQIMCLMFNLRTATYYARRKKGYDIERMLYQFPIQSYKSYGDNLEIKRRLKNNYYEVIVNNQFYIIHAKCIIENYQEQILWPILGYRIINFKDNGDASIMIDGKYKIKSYDEISHDIQVVAKILKTQSPRNETHKVASF